MILPRFEKLQRLQSKLDNSSQSIGAYTYGMHNIYEVACPIQKIQKTLPQH